MAKAKRPKVPKVVTNFKEIGKVTYIYLTLPLPASEDEEPETLTYQVRGLSPTEEDERAAILTSVPKPRPPMKKRISQNLTDKLVASELQEEEFFDLDDPTYLEQVELYDKDMTLAANRVQVYRLMCSVKGFDLTDEEIQAELNVDAHPRKPMESLLLRLDQISAIVLTDANQVHIGALQVKVMELSGVDVSRINFT